MTDFLIETGTEEIPARFLPGAMDSLKNLTESLLKQQLISFKAIKTYATPRRLAMIVEDVATRQEDSVQKIMGPPVSAAYDAQGILTKAAYGFAKSRGVDVNDLVVEDTERGKYIAAHIAQKGQQTARILEKSLPALITALPFPKSMRWGNGSIRFVRPIHWLVALLDSQLIQFELDGIQSGNITRGHRFLSPAAIYVQHVSTYVSQLKDHFVLVDQDERKKRIAEQIEALAQELNSNVHHDTELLDTVSYLVEYPCAVAGQFDPAYLELPESLLIIVMKSHQKFFSLEDKAGKLIPFFITVSNTTEDNADTVRKGAERVLKARLEDASFYYKEDKTCSFESRIDELKKVTFQEQLGTLYEKRSVLPKTHKHWQSVWPPHLNKRPQKQLCFLKQTLSQGLSVSFPSFKATWEWSTAVCQVKMKTLQRLFMSTTCQDLPMTLCLPLTLAPLCHLPTRSTT